MCVSAYIKIYSHLTEVRMEVVSVFNDKGGVGKTSITLEMAAGLSIVGKSVLLIDNDPQGTLSRSCVENAFSLDGMDSVYGGNKSLNDVIYETFLERMYIAPSGNSLKDYYVNLDSKISGRIESFFDLIRGDLAEIIDVVIIDNPPSQTGVSLECTMKSDRIVIPSRPDDVCFDALIRTYAFLEHQVQDFSQKAITIIPSIVENRKMHKDFTAAMRKRYDGMNDNTKVSVAIGNRAEVPMTIMEKKVLYVSHAASETSHQHKQMCLDVFPWLEKDLFLSAIDSIVEKKKSGIRDNFKAMVRKRMEERKKNTINQNKTVPA